MNKIMCISKLQFYFRFKNSFENCKRSVHELASHVKKVNELPPVTVENQYEILSQVITPWWQLDYTEQLIRKKRWTRDIVEKIKSKKVTRSKTRIHEILPSPTIESYRNKDEFNIRKGIDGNDKTVGFFIGSPADGNAVCVQPIKLISLRENHIILSEVYQKLIRDSPLKACHDLHDGGFWRGLTVRSNRKGDIMVIVTVNPAGASDDAMEGSKELIKERFLSTGLNITSLYHQACPHVRCSNEEAPFNLLHGDKYLYENINDVTVRLSPDSFIQVNIEAAELLYNAALSFANLNDKATVLDLCSGTGIISLLASRHVRGCIGIESIRSAVEDAKFNANYNDVTNCHFIAGRIETELKSVIKELGLASEVVPIINPGRAGVNNRVISLIRRTFNIRRLVYVSCKADSENTLRNFYELCSPTFNKSAPFFLTDVQPIDMFPLTKHCEVILVFKR